MPFSTASRARCVAWRGPLVFSIMISGNNSRTIFSIKIHLVSPPPLLACGLTIMIERFITGQAPSQDIYKSSKAAHYRDNVLPQFLCHQIAAVLSDV